MEGYKVRCFELMGEYTNLDKISGCQSTINILLRKEIATYHLLYQTEVESCECMAENESVGDTDEETFTEHWKKSLRRGIIQHNVRVVALYYRRIKGKLLATLLNLAPLEIESEVADMVSNAEIYAKFDRPNDVIRFQKARGAAEVLSGRA